MPAQVPSDPPSDTGAFFLIQAGTRDTCKVVQGVPSPCNKLTIIKLKTWLEFYSWMPFLTPTLLFMININSVPIKVNSHH